MAIKKRIGKGFSSVKIEGIDEINKALDSLPKKFRKNVLSLALKDGANIIVKAAQAKLAAGGHILTGRLYRSIGIVDRNKTNDDSFINFAVTPRRDSGFQGFAGHLLEFGHKLVILHPISKEPMKTRKKRVKKYPFMRPAYDQSARPAIMATINRSRSLARLLLKKELPGAKIR